jgi:hypothetical protein
MKAYTCAAAGRATPMPVSPSKRHQERTFKDSLRTAEIIERQKMAGESP